MNEQGPRKEGNERTGNRATGIRVQGSERLAQLLREALAPVEYDAGGSHDLWPAMLRRLRAESTREPVLMRIPWFDWALVGGLVALVALFPASIPVLLYYL